MPGKIVCLFNDDQSKFKIIFHSDKHRCHDQGQKMREVKNIEWIISFSFQFLNLLIRGRTNLSLTLLLNILDIWWWLVIDT